MINSNSNQARENIRAYILQHFDASGYEVEGPLDTFEQAAAFILTTFRREMKYRPAKLNEFQLFTDWAQGLPSVLDTCYYYNRSALEDLGGLLEYTAEELEQAKGRHTWAKERKAEEKITWLMFREMKRTAA